MWCFKKNNISFPNHYSICNRTIIDNLHDCQINQLTRFQLRAAKAIINEDRLVFSKSLGIARGVVEHAESYSNEEFIRPNDNLVIQKIRTKFKQQGIEFPNNYSVTFKNLVDEF